MTSSTSSDEVKSAPDRFAGFPAEAFTFYDGLEANNSRTHWQAHGPTFERAVRTPMAARWPSR